MLADARRRVYEGVLCGHYRTGGCRLSSRYPLVFEGELEAPTILHKAEFLLAGEPAHAHQQEAFRQGSLFTDVDGSPDRAAALHTESGGRD